VYRAGCHQASKMPNVNPDMGTRGRNKGIKGKGQQYYLGGIASIVEERFQGGIGAGIYVPSIL
jgi:hypothetical protein